MELEQSTNNLENLNKPEIGLQVYSEVIADFIQKTLGGSLTSADIALVSPPNPELGDFSSPLALKLAKQKKTNPIAIAQSIKLQLEAEKPAWMKEISVTNGYLNFILDESLFARQVLTYSLDFNKSTPLISSLEFPSYPKKIIIEHTNINANKAAHIGHLRNACLGDTLSRILKRSNHLVEVENYIDDTGLQVAEVVYGLQNLKLTPKGHQSFDAFCSQVYVKAHKVIEANPHAQQQVDQILKDIEAGNNSVAIFAKETAKKIVASHLATMENFGISYDLLTWESDILKLGFWKEALQKLLEKEIIHPAQTEKNKGCLVMDLDEQEKVIVKSNGVVTYTGKDIAYQLWKLGKLELDFYYEPWNNSSIKTTSSTPGAILANHHFGKAARVINVIDSRQAYPQQVVKFAVEKLGFSEAAANSIHLDYGVVELSAAAAAKLGIKSNSKKVALSGRLGIEVQVDKLLLAAKKHLRSVNTDKPLPRATINALAIGGLRYYMLKFSLQQKIVFDFDEAFKTTGNTGTYLQYAYARSVSLLSKINSKSSVFPPTVISEVEKNLLKLIADYSFIVAKASFTQNPQLIAEYAYTLSNAFSSFYEKTPPLYKETNSEILAYRVALTKGFQNTLRDCMDLLAIPILNKI